MANPKRDPETPCFTEFRSRIEQQLDKLHAFVIGGGPSLTGFDFNRIWGKGGVVLGANMAWMLPQTQIAYFYDQRLVERECQRLEWNALEPVRLLPPWGRQPGKWAGHGVYWVPWNAGEKDGRPVWGKSLVEGIVRVKNTGMQLVNIAEILGCDPIYLLGFDCDTVGGEYKNWHSDYPKAWTPTVYGKAFEAWISDWHAVKDQIRARVVNLNPASKLQVFPKLPLEEVL